MTLSLYILPVAEPCRKEESSERERKGGEGERMGSVETDATVFDREGGI